MITTDLFEGRHDKNIFKALFICGVPGAGKSTVERMLNLPSEGIKSVDVDYLRHFLQTDSYDDAGAKTKGMLAHFINSHLGLSISRTGRNPDSIIRTNNQLNDHYYKTAMIFVHTDFETGRRRIEERSIHSKIPQNLRKVDMDYFLQAYEDISKYIPLYQQMFGDHFFIFENDKNWKANLGKLKSQVNSFLAEPLTPEAAKLMNNVQYRYSRLTMPTGSFDENH